VITLARLLLALVNRQFVSEPAPVSRLSIAGVAVGLAGSGARPSPRRLAAITAAIPLAPVPRLEALLAPLEQATPPSRSPTTTPLPQTAA